jgi:hypothetical protein
MNKPEVAAPDAKVLFGVQNKEGGTDVETLWAHKLGADHYKLDNVPLCPCGVSLNDIVYAPFNPQQNFPAFEKVVFKSGNRTIGINLDSPSEPGNKSEELLNKLVKLGCGYEGSNRTYISVNIPSSVILSEITALLEQSEAQWEHVDPS